MRRPPAIQRRRDDSVHARAAMRCCSPFVSAQVRGIANEDDFTIFVVVRRHGQPLSLYGCRILITKELAYGAAGVCEGDACSVPECTNDDGTECAGFGGASGTAANSSGSGAAARAGTGALD